MAGRRFVWLWMAVVVAFALVQAERAEARVPRANLHELRLRAPSGQLAARAGFDVRDVVRNEGRRTARRTAVGYYLSRNAVFGRGDLRLGGRAVRALRRGRSSSGRKRLHLPPGVAAGRYRLLACADYLRRVRETTERDNCVAAPGALRLGAVHPEPSPQPQPEPGPDTPAAMAVTIDSPAEGSATAAADPAFSGHAAPGSFVTVSVAQGGAEQRSLQALPADDGSWSVTASGLSEGNYTATASQTDAFGRTQASAPRSFRVDRTGPGVALTTPADGSTTPEANPTVSGARGTAAGDSAAVTVKVYRASRPTGDPIVTLPVASPGTQWSTKVEADLGSGTYTAQAEQSDSAGNVGRSSPHVFQVDDAGPTVTLANPPNGSRTSDTAPTFDGSTDLAGPAVTVRIYQGPDTTGSVAQTLTASPTGSSWTVDLDAQHALTPGASYTAQASQVDGVGNVGLSAPHAFTVDTTAPAVTVSHPSGFTGDTTPTFDGTAGTAAGDLDPIAVDVFNGSATSGTAVLHLATTATGGAWSATPSTALAEGTYTAVTRQSDSAGNEGTNARAFTVDTTPPAVTVTSPASSPPANDSTPTFAGTAEAGQQPVTVKIYSGTAATGTPVSTLTANGANWNATQPSALSDGQYTVVAEQTDQAGNTGTSQPRGFTIDVTGPKVTLAQPADGAITNDPKPTFSGTAEDTTQVSVKIYVGTSLSRTLTVTPAGGNWSVAPGTALPQGAYTVQAEQRDSANNLGQSTLRRFEIDTTPPTLTLTVNASRTGVHVVADDSNFSSLACTADGQPATVASTPNSTHDAEGDVSVAGDGGHTVACTAGDEGANSTSGSRTFTLDSTPPVVGLTTPAAGATIDDPTPAFTGPAGTAAGDAATVTLKVYAGSGTAGTTVRTLTAPVSGSAWAITDTTNLPEGTYTAQAQQTDSAGHTGTSPAHVFTIGPATMLAAGDIGGCEDGNDAAGTAAILRAHPQGIVQTLGDNVYGNPQFADGTLADFENCYGPNWGTEKARTKPAVGNHEYNDPGAAGYFAYFGAEAGKPSEGWYSYDLGGWHVVVLNSNCSQVGGCAAGSDQETFLKNDLAAHANQCTAAVWHHPRFTSDAFTGQATSTGQLWTDLYNAHADLILNGHAHEYERFAKQSPSGASDPTNGIVEIVAGMGGESHSTFASTFRPNSAAHDNTHYGVLQLTLHQTSWSWSLLPVGGGAPLDSGTANCRP